MLIRLMNSAQTPARLIRGGVQCGVRTGVPPTHAHPELLPPDPCGKSASRPHAHGVISPVKEGCLADPRSHLHLIPPTLTHPQAYAHAVITNLTTAPRTGIIILSLEKSYRVWYCLQGRTCPRGQEVL
jgi:hypothetical protein